MSEPKEQAAPAREIDINQLAQIERQSLTQCRQRAAVVRAELEDAERSMHVATGRMQMIEELGSKQG